MHSTKWILCLCWWKNRKVFVDLSAANYRISCLHHVFIKKAWVPRCGCKCKIVQPLKNSSSISVKVNPHLTCAATISLLAVYPKDMKTFLYQDLSRSTHSSIIHNSPKLEITQYHPPVKQTVIYPYNRVLLSRKKAWITCTHSQHVWVSETACSVKAVGHRGIHTTWIP